MANLYGTVEVWLRHPKAQPGDEPVLVTHPDTLARCLAEGWTVVEVSTQTPAERPPASGDSESSTPGGHAVRIAAQRATRPSRARAVKPAKGASHGR